MTESGRLPGFQASRHRLRGGPTEFRVASKRKQLGSARAFWGSRKFETRLESRESVIQKGSFLTASWVFVMRALKGTVLVFEG